MTYSNNTIMLVEDEGVGNMANKHGSKIQDKKIWKSLRTHILSRREINKKAKFDAEILRKKKCVEYQKIEENKLSLAQINGRLSQLQDKRTELEEEKRALLNQTQSSDDSLATSVQSKNEPYGENVNNKILLNNNINNAIVSNHRSITLPQQHLFRQQNTVNSQSSAGSPATGSGLSPLPQQSFQNTNNTGGGMQSLLVCSNTINDNINQDSVTRTMSSLSSAMTYTKFSSLYSTHLSGSNVGTITNKSGRIPSPQQQSIQQQNYQQQMLTPFSTYKAIDSGGCTSNNLSSAATAPVVNNINQSLTTATNSNYSIENSKMRGGRDDHPPYNINVWINNTNNKNSQPNVNNYGSFYQPTSTTAVNYCVNNGMSSSSSSLSSVNTVYSYSGPPPSHIQRTDSVGCGNIMASVANEQLAQQIPKPVTSHQLHHSHPPMYMSPSIRNQTNNYAYHSKPIHNVYPDEKLVSNASNFYQPHGNRTVHSSNTTTVPSQPHQMNQKPHNIGYPMRHPTASSSMTQHTSAIIQSSQHGSYNIPTSSVTVYSNKSPATVVSTTDISRFQQSSEPPMSRHE